MILQSLLFHSIDFYSWFLPSQPLWILTIRICVLDHWQCFSVKVGWILCPRWRRKATWDSGWHLHIFSDVCRAVFGIFAGWAETAACSLGSSSRSPGGWFSAAHPRQPTSQQTPRSQIVRQLGKMMLAFFGFWISRKLKTCGAKYRSELRK